MCKDGECGDNSPIATLANLTPETCFIDPESGVQICKWSDVDKHNNTDAHRENGIYDFHNDFSDEEKQAVGGQVPADSSSDAGDNHKQWVSWYERPRKHNGGEGERSPQATPAPMFQKHDGNTDLAGLKTDRKSGSHDIHTEEKGGVREDHEKQKEEALLNYVSETKDKKGPVNEFFDVDKGWRVEKEKDDQTKGGVMNVAAKGNTEEWMGLKFKDLKENGNNTIEIKHEEKSKYQKTEHNGNGVYDFHEQSSESNDASARYSGNGDAASWRADLHKADEQMKKAFQDYAGARYRNMTVNHHKREISYSKTKVSSQIGTEQPIGMLATDEQSGQNFTVHNIKGQHNMLSTTQVAERMRVDVEAMRNNLNSMVDCDPGFFLGFVMSVLIVCFLITTLTKRLWRMPVRTRATYIALTEIGGASSDRFCNDV